MQVKITPYSNLGDLRTGTIAIRAGTQEHVITIHQQPSSDTPSIVVEGLTDGGVVCDAEGMPQSFRVNANVAWEAGTEDLGWAVVTPSKGAAGTSVRIVVTPEENDGAERSGTLIIRRPRPNGASPSASSAGCKPRSSPSKTLPIITCGLRRATLRSASA